MKNLAIKIWNKNYDLPAYKRSLSGEINSTQNPILWEYCQSKNDPDRISCMSCEGELKFDLPRICPQCSHSHTPDTF